MISESFLTLKISEIRKRGYCIRASRHLGGGNLICTYPNDTAFRVLWPLSILFTPMALSVGHEQGSILLTEKSAALNQVLVAEPRTDAKPSYCRKWCLISQSSSQGAMLHTTSEALDQNHFTPPPGPAYLVPYSVWACFGKRHLRNTPSNCPWIIKQRIILCTVNEWPLVIEHMPIKLFNGTKKKKKKGLELGMNGWRERT